MAKKSTDVVPVDEAGKKPPRKLLFLVVAVVLSLSAAAGGLIMSFGLDETIALISGGDKNQENPQDAPGGEHGAPSDGENGAPSDKEAEAQNAGSDLALTVDPMKEIVVNITAVSLAGRKSTRFLKLNLALVFDEHAEGAEHVTDRRVYIRDAFQNYLRQLTERDLSGTIGVLRLKSELLRRARAITESDAPKEVLISDIIIQ